MGLPARGRDARTDRQFVHVRRAARKSWIPSSSRRRCFCGMGTRTAQLAGLPSTQPHRRGRSGTGLRAAERQLRDDRERRVGTVAAEAGRNCDGSAATCGDARSTGIFGSSSDARVAVVNWSSLPSVGITKNDPLRNQRLANGGRTEPKLVADPREGTTGPVEVRRSGCLLRCEALASHGCAILTEDF